MAVLRQALELADVAAEPLRADLLDMLVQLEVRRGNLKAALAVVEQAKGGGTALFLVETLRGIAHHQAGDHTAAAAAAKAALVLLTPQARWLDRRRVALCSTRSSSMPRLLDYCAIW